MRKKAFCRVLTLNKMQFGFMLEREIFDGIEELMLCLS